MKKLTFILLTLLALTARADEGMWVMGNISEKTDSVLRSLGLELTAEELYSTEHPSLNNAIIQLGGFCSGVVVSDEGLVFTNHHCGFSAIQTHSAPEHDYLKYGFYAKKLEDELPNEGLYVLFHIKTVDVTDLILSAVPEGASDMQKDVAIDSVSGRLMEMVNYSGKGIQSEVNPFYKGSKYFLSVYQRFDDVRLVYAPPQCLGKYGGDTDNWMWPRQTCDFSVFRIYADKNNAPAEYSKDNVPYHPLQYARVSTQGYQDGSYAMTLGYPGSTDRYLSSYGIESTMRTLNDVRYQVRGVKLDVLREVMRQSDSIRIMYASKYASSSNYWKFSLGQNQALENLKVVEEKQQQEQDLKEWSKKDVNKRGKYICALDSLKSIYESEASVLYGNNLWMESFYRGSDILGLVLKNVASLNRGSEDEKFQEKVENAYKNIDVETDKKVFLSLLKNYVKQASETKFQIHEILHEIDCGWIGDYSRYVDNLYATSVFARPDEIRQVSSFREVVDDPMVKVARQLLNVYTRQLSVSGSEQEYERILGDGIREMNHDREYYPDANFTLRLSYGLCKPIDFTPGTTGLKEEATQLITSPRSFLNKHEQNPDNYDYRLIPSVYKWMKKGKFSARYIDKATGELPLCFLTTNDITGGNSGSPVLNARGELIGLAFDGNKESLCSDAYFHPDYCKTVSVDIRYVLWILKYYAEADHILQELEF